MIDFSTKRISFTDGYDFTLSASAYTGFFHIIDSIPYAGIDATDNSIELDKSLNVSADILTSKFFYDRLVTDAVTLPYSFEHDIRIAPNDTYSTKLFNDRLFKLHQNFLYLYSQLFLASNNIPNGYDRAAGTSKNTDSIVWAAESSQSGTSFNPFASAGYAEIDNIIQMEAKLGSIPSYSFFGISPTAFISLSADYDLTTIDVVKIAYNVAENNDMRFTNLTSFSVAGNYAFLCDSAQNNIYKYDVSGFFIGDPSITNRLIFVNSVGGYGSALMRTKFNSPDKVFAIEEENRIYVHDRGNRCVKIFDFELSYQGIKTFTAGVEEYVQTFGYNNLFGYVYMLNRQQDAYILYICDKDLNTIEQYTLEDILEDDESYNNITFSATDSNIIYITTNKNVYKKFVNKPMKTIGKWLPYNSSTNASHIWNLETIALSNAQWFLNDGGESARSTLPIVGMSNFAISDIDNREQLFLFVGSLDKSFNRILHYRERNAFNSALGVTTLNCYNKQQIFVADSEFIDSTTINRELYKSAYNTFNVIRFITGRYTAEYDYLNNLVYSGMMPLTDSEFSTLNRVNSDNIYVHDNEIMSSGTINRCFKTIFDLQSTALNLIQTQVTNFVSSVSGTRTVVLS